MCQYCTVNVGTLVHHNQSPLHHHPCPTCTWNTAKLIALAWYPRGRYDKVNDLRSEFSGEMLRTLQSKVGPFGVDILNVKITDVALPRELQERLEKTTAFRTR